MTAEQVAVRRGLYADSVTLMLVSREVGQAEGVIAALVAMATELNLALLGQMGFAAPDSSSANDLFVAIRALDEATLARATAQATQLLEQPERSRGSGLGAGVRPRTVGMAARSAGVGLAVISVPGPHVFTEAMDALESGCDVLIFSDNVSIADEIVLKDRAAERGLLVMGPDCGTAVVGGIGLGFAHTLDRGPVGLVAASGTGAQQVLCLLDAAGVGISAAIGVGGRDLSGAVAGRSTRGALALLDRDPATEHIIVVSKPPSPLVAADLRAAAIGLRKTVQFAMLGPGQPDLTAATEDALRAIGRVVPEWPTWRPLAKVDAIVPRSGTLRGLFCGGTLCDEAMLIASAVLGPIRSNIPLRPEWSLDGSMRSAGHSMIDFGDDALTRGRAHPMIDPTLRTQHLRSSLADRRTGVVLLDVVLGHGSHLDPVAELLPLVSASAVPVVVSLIGARRDPQGLESSAARLCHAGAAVFSSNAEAARYAVALLRREGPG